MGTSNRKMGFFGGIKNWLICDSPYDNVNVKDALSSTAKAREMAEHRNKTRIIGLTLAGFCLAVYFYTFRALKQETFLEMDEETFLKLKKERELKEIEDTLVKQNQDRYV